MVRYVHEKMQTDHLTAADRLAITKALAVSSVEKSPSGVLPSAASGASTEEDYPSLSEGSRGGHQ